MELTTCLHHGDSTSVHANQENHMPLYNLKFKFAFNEWPFIEAEDVTQLTVGNNAGIIQYLARNLMFLDIARQT